MKIFYNYRKFEQVQKIESKFAENLPSWLDEKFDEIEKLKRCG